MGDESENYGDFGDLFNFIKSLPVKDPSRHSKECPWIPSITHLEVPAYY